MSLKSLTSTHTVTHKRWTVARGAAGGQIRTPSTIGVKVCRVKQLTATEVAALKKQGLRGDWKLWFNVDPAADERDYFEYVDTAGVTHTMNVVGIRNPHQLDRFFIVMCEEHRDVENV